jgi:hypothetical protein
MKLYGWLYWVVFVVTLGSLVVIKYTSQETWGADVVYIENVLEITTLVLSAILFFGFRAMVRDEESRERQERKLSADAN